MHCIRCWAREPDVAVSLEVTRQSIATQNVVSPVGVEIVAERTGSYRGEKVTNSRENSKISQAGPGASTSEAVRADPRSLQQRVVRQGQATSLQANARIADFYDKLPNMPDQAQLENLVGTLRTFEAAVSTIAHHVAPHLMETLVVKREQQQESLKDEQQGAPDGEGGSGPGRDDIFKALQSFDADPSHQYAALDIARDHFASSGASQEFLAILDDAATEFDKTDVARDVRAGFAVAKIARDAAETLETSPAAVRESYRTLLREQMNVGQLFDSLAKFDMSKNFSAIVEIFRTAAGQDLASTGPSTDPTFLHALLTEIGKLKKMQTIFEMGGDLIKETERTLVPRERGLTDATQVTSAVLNFVSKATVNLNDARNLLGGMQQSSPAGQVVFANGLRGLHGQIPDDIMPSGAARLQQGATLATLLNTLVANEEAHFAQSH